MKIFLQLLICLLIPLMFIGFKKMYEWYCRMELLLKRIDKGNG
jgi:hypothetical protein